MSKIYRNNADHVEASSPRWTVTVDEYRQTYIFHSSNPQPLEEGERVLAAGITLYQARVLELATELGVSIEFK